MSTEAAAWAGGALECPALDAACEELVRLALHTEADRVVLTVRPDGRVEVRGEWGPYDLWRVEADTAVGSALPSPIAALRTGPKSPRRPVR